MAEEVDVEPAIARAMTANVTFEDTSIELRGQAQIHRTLAGVEDLGRQQRGRAVIGRTLASVVVLP